MMNSDPKYFKNAVLLEKVSFDEAIELAYFGAKVIHPKTIRPLENKNIPLFVKSFLDPQSEGTEISNFNSVNYPEIIVVKENNIKTDLFYPHAVRPTVHSTAF